MTKLRVSEARMFWIVAAAVTVFVYFFGLTIPLVGPDEPRYAQVAREMFDRSDWVTPTLGGYNWFEKPALLYWLQIASYNLFGVSEFSARFGSAIFGLGTVASLWLLGRRVEDAGEAGKLSGERFSNWMALMAASSIGLVVFARGASFDIVVTFPLTAAMVCFFLFDLAENRSADEGSEHGVYFPLIGFYVFAGLALLAKGLIGIVFPYAIAGAYLLLSRRLPSKRLVLSLVWGTAVAIAVASAWYLPMYLRNGWEFIDEFFIQHHFQRYTSNKYLHPQPFHFFLWVLPLMTIPWMPLFLAAVWKFAKRAIGRYTGRTASDEISGGSKASGPGRVGQNEPETGSVRRRLSPASAALLRFSAAWVLIPLVFFSFSGSKLPGYILPALPPAIVLSAIYVMEFIRGNERRAAVLKALAMATYVVVVALIIFIVPRFADMDSVKGLLELADRRGLGDERVLTMHTVSHNAEFYAPGRLVRDTEGRQKRLPGVAEVLNEIRKTESGGALVLVPVEYQHQLLESPLLDSEILRGNGELAIAYVRAR